jgi:hypothetical protein
MCLHMTQGANKSPGLSHKGAHAIHEGRDPQSPHFLVLPHWILDFNVRIGGGGTHDTQTFRSQQSLTTVRSSQESFES